MRASASPRSCHCRRKNPTGRSSTSCSAPTSGNVRRNSLADFVEVNTNGKIAMKLDEGDSHRRRGDVLGGRRRSADHLRRSRDPLRGRRRARVQGPRLRPASAASCSETASASSRCPFCAISRRHRPSETPSSSSTARSVGPRPATRWKPRPHQQLPRSAEDDRRRSRPLGRALCRNGRAPAVCPHGDAS